MDSALSTLFVEKLANIFYDVVCSRIPSEKELINACVELGERYPVIATKMLSRVVVEAANEKDCLIAITTEIIRSGDLDLLKEFLKDNLDYLEEVKMMAFAIKEHAWDIVKYLIEIKAAIPAPNELPPDYVPDSKEGLVLLKSIGIEIKSTESLTKAICSNNWDVVECLIGAGVVAPKLSDLPLDYAPSSARGVDLLKSIGIEGVFGTCKYTFTRGSNKGKQCGTPTKKGSDFCNICITKKTVQASIASPNTAINVPPIKASGPTSALRPYIHQPGKFIFNIGSLRGVVIQPALRRSKAIGVDEENNGTIRPLTEEEKEKLKEIGFNV